MNMHSTAFVRHAQETTALVDSEFMEALRRMTEITDFDQVFTAEELAVFASDHAGRELCGPVRRSIR